MFWPFAVGCCAVLLAPILVFLLAVYTVLGVAALVHFICSFVVCLVLLAYIFTGCSCCCMCLLVCWPGSLLLLI
jgi:thiosulfate reductase cytochrome b subunit